MARRAMHRQTGTTEFANVQPAFDGAALTTVFGSESHGYFFLPSFNVIFSPAYFTPLPL
jgi:hypothetical protein